MEPQTISKNMVRLRNHNIFKLGKYKTLFHFFVFVFLIVAMNSCSDSVTLKPEDMTGWKTRELLGEVKKVAYSDGSYIKFNRDGNITDEKVNDITYTRKWKNPLQYKLKGGLILNVTFNDSMRIEKSEDGFGNEYVFDQRGRVILFKTNLGDKKEKYYYKGKSFLPFQKVEGFWDESGFHLFIKTYTYTEFDKQGNWLKCTVEVAYNILDEEILTNEIDLGEKESYNLERTIEYYQPLPKNEKKMSFSIRYRNYGKMFFYPEFKLAGEGTAIIDWGDDSEQQIIELKPFPFKLDDDISTINEYDRERYPLYTFSHKYAEYDTYTITVTGGSITHLCIIHLEVTDIDVSQNPNLEYLIFGCNPILNSPISSLDVTKNKSLKELAFRFTSITELDLSKNPELLTLYCGNNLLTSLDLTNNTKLMRLDCTRNKLSTEALTKLFESLHENPIIAPYHFKRVSPSGNPGKYNSTIAELKGWDVK